MYGTTSDTGGAGQPGGGFGGGGYQYQSQIDPEELFRTIFGDAFRQGRDFESIFDDFGSDSRNSGAYDITQVKKIYILLFMQ